MKVLLGVPERQLRIPAYQRPYAWEEEQVDELWEDIANATGRAHFMGSLVLTGEDPRVLDVIDGQQRLTTLLLLLGLIRDRWRALRPENVATICGKDSKDLERVYHRAAKALWDSDGKDLAGARKLLIEPMPGRDEFIAAFRKQVMGRKYVVDYVLRKIETSLDTEEKTTHGTSAVHIEHVLPQSLSDDWKVVLGDRVGEHAAHVDRWGNLTLLGGRKNIKASNGLFGKKRVIYAESAIKLTNRLAGRESWDLDAIDARQVELAKLADAVWAVPDA